MNEHFKEDWIEALRSGRYKQGMNVLQEGDRYCCLGVAAEIFCDRYDTEDSVSKQVTFHRVMYNGMTSFPPSPMLNAIGLSVTQVKQLAHMNDVDNKTFPEIADWIERNL